MATKGGVKRAPVRVHVPTVSELLRAIGLMEGKLGEDWWDMDPEALETAKKKILGDSLETTRLMAAALAGYTQRPQKDPVAFLHFMMGINGIEHHPGFYEALSAAQVLYGLIVLYYISDHRRLWGGLSGKVLEVLVPLMTIAGLPIYVLAGLPGYRRHLRDALRIFKDQTGFPKDHLWGDESRIRDPDSLDQEHLAVILGALRKRLNLGAIVASVRGGLPPSNRAPLESRQGGT